MPDPKYGDRLVTKFMNIIMLNGKKSTAESIVYGAFEVVQERTREDPLKIFHRALENCQPSYEVKSRRVGGATYQVPIEVREGRQMALAMRWAAMGNLAIDNIDEFFKTGNCTNKVN
jgi:small subunit ribosomal protein S7